MIDVNANVEDFIYPKNNKIVNEEILRKYSLMCNFCRVLVEDINIVLKEVARLENERVKKANRYMKFARGATTVLGVSMSEATGIPLSPVASLAKKSLLKDYKEEPIERVFPNMSDWNPIIRINNKL